MPNTPTKDYSWLASHPEIEEKYLGEWIAVHDGQVIAHGRDLDRIIKETSQQDPPPHISYVEEAVLAAYALRFFL